jgi:hypothetical protein
MISSPPPLTETGAAFEQLVQQELPLSFNNLSCSNGLICFVFNVF